MSTATKRTKLDEQLVELARDVAPDPAREDEINLVDCAWCGYELDEDAFCPACGATALGGLPEPR